LRGGGFAQRQFGIQRFQMLSLRKQLTMGIAPVVVGALPAVLGFVVGRKKSNKLKLFS